jgi:hypothetical protein
MSQDFNQTNQQNTERVSTSQSTKPNNTWIFIAVIVLLLGVIIWLFLSKNKATDQRDQAYSQLDTVSTDRDNMKTEYDAALARLDLLVTKNAQLDSMVNGKDSEISRLKTQIQNILSNSRANASDLSKARVLIARLNGKVKTYEERIAELEGANTRLTNYSKVIEQERDSTVTTNIALAQKVRLGAVLHVSNIRMTPIDLRRNGRKEKETGRAKRVDVFRIVFDIDENRIAEDGVKDLYLRIVGPNGKLLTNSAYGSGETDTYNGDPLTYTLAKQVSLKQGEPVRNVMVDWHQDNTYDRGTYNIEIYNEGYKIGAGSINLN